MRYEAGAQTRANMNKLVILPLLVVFSLVVTVQANVSPEKRKEIEKLLRLPLTVIEVTSPDIASSHKLRRSHGLFVNDSINLACANARRSTFILAAVRIMVRRRIA